MDCMAGVRAEDLEERGGRLGCWSPLLHGRKRIASEQIGVRRLSDGAVGIRHHRVYQFDIELEFLYFPGLLRKHLQCINKRY